jgi:choline dehydrogenase
VRGVKGLRVVDSCIIPSSMSANLYPTQIMIAEKAADIIREKDTVLAIKEYFKHLIATKHKKMVEDEEDAAPMAHAHVQS